MKKIILLLAIAATATLTSCTFEENGQDVIENNYVLEAEVFEISNVDFNENSNGNFQALYALDPAIEPADMILVYRLSDDAASGNDVWELIPRTIYLDGTDEIDYDFNFSQNDILLYMDATFDLNNAPAFTQNQVFRVVIIPGYDSTAKMNADFSNYKAVVERYGLDEANIKTLNRK